MSNPPPASAPSIKAELEEIILRALATPYMSESGRDRIKTTNHYQSVTLGERHTEGFRTGRTHLLDRVAFEGKRVLDLGSNLGELSRSARARGAQLVDGFESDPYFLELAHLINACNETSRVSFYRRDITNPATFSEPYDIVMAFSVFIYIRDIFEHVAPIARQALILETHMLENNLESVYLAAITPHFPRYRILGETEWGTTHDENVKRAVIVFARDDAALAATLKE